MTVIGCISEYNMLETNNRLITRRVTRFIDQTVKSHIHKKQSVVTQTLSSKKSKLSDKLDVENHNKYQPFGPLILARIDILHDIDDDDDGEYL